MASIQCTTDIPSAVQVGTHLLWHCAGDEALKGLKAPKIQIDKSGPHDLVLLSATPSATGADLVLTSYAVGNHDWQNVQIVDGSLVFDAGPFHLQVQSVMDPKQQRTEPFGPQGPLGLHVPWWYWALWIIFFAAIAGSILIWVRHFRRRRQELQKIENENSTQDPTTQWNLRLRGFRKRLENQPASEGFPPDTLSTLRSAWTVYLARRWKIAPSARSPLRERRRALGSAWAKHGEKLLRLEHEIEELEKKLQRGVPAGPATADLIFDLNHVTRDLRVWVDQVEADQNGGKR